MRATSESAILENLVLNNKTSADSSEVSLETGISELSVIEGFERIIRDGYGIDGSSKDGACLILNSRSKLALSEGVYD